MRTVVPGMDMKPRQHLVFLLVILTPAAIYRTSGASNVTDGAGAVPVTTSNGHSFAVNSSRSVSQPGHCVHMSLIAIEYPYFRVFVRPSLVRMVFDLIRAVGSVI